MFLFGFQFEFSFIEIGLFFDEFLKSFIECILGGHIGLNLMYFFEYCIFIIIIIFIQFIVVAFDSVFDEI